MKKIQKLILISLAIIALAGSCNDDIIKDKKGVVKDYSGLDGCGLLIELEGGNFLQPYEIVPDIELKEGQQVKINFSLLEGVGSTCMKGDIVKITKIKILN